MRIGTGICMGFVSVVLYLDIPHLCLVIGGRDPASRKGRQGRILTLLVLAPLELVGAFERRANIMILFAVLARH